jgi:hypothetical protein
MVIRMPRTATGMASMNNLSKIANDTRKKTSSTQQLAQSATPNVHAPLVRVGQVGHGALGRSDVQVEAEGAHEAEQGHNRGWPSNLGVAKHGKDLEIVHSDGHECEVLRGDGTE